MVHLTAPSTRRPSGLRGSVLSLLFAGATMTGCASVSEWIQGPPPAANVVDGVLVGPGGMTLYTFDRDTAGSGTSACLAQCAANWPPLLAASDARAKGDWSLVPRPGGSRQWAYKGQPLYYWNKDAKPGDRTGDGFNSAWRLARP